MHWHGFYKSQTPLLINTRQTQLSLRFTGAKLTSMGNSIKLLINLHQFSSLLLLFPLLITADEFLSIDCGATGSYTDDNGILWTGDDLYIQNGDSHIVENSNSASQVMSTLRAFPTRKKSCYPIIGVGKGSKNLVRASFFYGNYDKLSSPPVFDLQFDGNLWTTVETSIDEMVYYQIVYVAKRDDISVCVAQTEKNQIPFMSALEVRTLDSKMYSQVPSDYPLFSILRVAFGAPGIVRFPDDPYDRIWLPSATSSKYTNVSSDSSIMVATLDDNPPTQVLETAVTPTNPSNPIIFSYSFPEIPISIYLTMYFAELTELDSTQKRSFEIFINGTKAYDHPLVPPYQSALEFYNPNLTVSSTTNFSLIATSDSTLPPILNAMEIFLVSDIVLTDGTNSKDVEALSQLQVQFDPLQAWSGDPCLPANFTWEWVECSSDAIPRITALNLGGFDLSGFLPDFSGMDALQTIDMHNNSLTGDIPDFLGTLPKLKDLNLADNSLSGSVPSSLTSNKIKLDVSGNPNLCSGKSCQNSDSGTSTNTVPSVLNSSPTGKKKKKNNTGVIVGTTIPAAFVASCIAIVVGLFSKRRRAAAAIHAGQAGGQQGPHHPGKPPPQQVAQGFGGQDPEAAQGQTTAETFGEEIGQQIGSELDDLMQQHAEGGQQQNTQQV